MTSPVTTIAYRGQYLKERSRVDFIVAAAASIMPCHVVLLNPLGAEDGEAGEAAAVLARTHPTCQVTEIASPASQTRDQRRKIGALLGCGPVIAIGFTAPEALPGRRADVWFINGIPEERLLSSRSLKSRFIVALRWRRARRVCRSLTVVVSDPMAELMQDRSPGRTLVVPNAVDTAIFDRSGTADSDRRYLTYLGGGSPWQGIDRLASVWAAVHRLEPHQRFCVISQDPRTTRLIDHLPTELVRRVSTDEPADVARALGEARLGFLYRRPCLVNRVAAPMKLGEYLASGVSVVASRCGWDLEQTIEQHSAGIIVDWDASTTSTAQQIVDHLRSADDGGGPIAAAETLGTNRWTDVLRTALRETCITHRSTPRTR